MEVAKCGIMPGSLWDVLLCKHNGSIPSIVGPGRKRVICATPLCYTDNSLDVVSLSCVVARAMRRYIHVVSRIKTRHCVAGTYIALACKPDIVSSSLRTYLCRFAILKHLQRLC